MNIVVIKHNCPAVINVELPVDLAALGLRLAPLRSLVKLLTAPGPSRYSKTAAIKIPAALHPVIPALSSATSDVGDYHELVDRKSAGLTTYTPGDWNDHISKLLGVFPVDWYDFFCISTVLSSAAIQPQDNIEEVITAPS